MHLPTLEEFYPNKPQDKYKQVGRKLKCKGNEVPPVVDSSDPIRSGQMKERQGKGMKTEWSFNLLIDQQSGYERQRDASGVIQVKNSRKKEKGREIEKNAMLTNGRVKRTK